MLLIHRVLGVLGGQPGWSLRLGSVPLLRRFQALA
jgi:hypothetical protein